MQYGGPTHVGWIVKTTLGTDFGRLWGFPHYRMISCVLGCNCTLLNEALSAVDTSLELVENATKICDSLNVNCPVTTNQFLKEAESILTDVRTHLDNKFNHFKCSQR